MFYHYRLIVSYQSPRLLEKGYNTDAFTDPQKALQQFVQVNPSCYDLVVMDIIIPVLNGRHLL
jgi:CheY-like chemotaxis protein